MVGRADILSARILIVDDSSVNVLLLERILTNAGYTAVSTTSDSSSVCRLYRENQYDLILLDLLMPGLDGFQVMHALKEIETEGYLPVLVLTAQPGHKLRALQAGAKDFLGKPFDRIEVLTRIHNMLEVRLLLREAKNYSRWLEQFDQLTGLPNRMRYREQLTKALGRPEARTGTVSLLFIAVDRFRSVSDAVGRVVGGALLRSVGERLAGCIGPMDTAARLGGYEFALLVVSPERDPRAAGELAVKVRDILRPPLESDGQEVAITVSIGIAAAPTDSLDGDTLMQYAETALHEAGDAGGDTYRYFSAELNARARVALELENALRNALARNEFVLHYQPKMRIDTGEWSGVEALLRWNRPGRGLVPPGEFISALESTGLIVPVGTWVIETVCRQIGEWSRDGIGHIRVAVNVSGKQFLRSGFVSGIARAIRDNDIAPESLDIEITESSLMSRSEQTDNVLRELKKLGVWIAIDDFGTGYSSLAYLKQFPIDTLKIDMSFIRDVPTDSDGAAIAIAIINMARSLSMTVIAEGVETAPQLEFLRQHACDEIQGYYCSRPLPAADLVRLSEEHRAGARQPMAASAAG